VVEISFPSLQMLLSNLTGVQFAAGGGGGGFVPVMPLYGNPGDYAWGRGGLDAVVTNLLNQVSISPTFYVQLLRS
jgi:E3 ubiquitin-protein ligase RNF115/126